MCVDNVWTTFYRGSSVKVSAIFDFAVSMAQSPNSSSPSSASNILSASHNVSISFSSTRKYSANIIT